jgi:hypothetical protein
MDRNEQHRQYCKTHREQLRESERKYWTANRDKKREKDRRYYQRHKERIKESVRQYADAHPEKRAEALAALANYIDRIKLGYGCRNPSCKWKSDFHPACLDFHHLDPSQKKYRISGTAIRKREVLIAEIRKCTVLCAIYHRLVTFGLLDDSNFPVCEINDNGDILTK